MKKYDSDKIKRSTSARNALLNFGLYGVFAQRHIVTNFQRASLKYCPVTFILSRNNTRETWRMYKITWRQGEKIVCLLWKYKFRSNSYWQFIASISIARFDATTYMYGRILKPWLSNPHWRSREEIVRAVKRRNNAWSKHETLPDGLMLVPFLSRALRSTRRKRANAWVQRGDKSVAGLIDAPVALIS